MSPLSLSCFTAPVSLTLYCRRRLTASARLLPEAVSAACTTSGARCGKMPRTIFTFSDSDARFDAGRGAELTGVIAVVVVVATVGAGAATTGCGVAMTVATTTGGAGAGAGAVVGRALLLSGIVSTESLGLGC